MSLAVALSGKDGCPLGQVTGVSVAIILAEWNTWQVQHAGRE